MKYAAAYIRVSDDRQDEYSPDSQLKLIREYAGRNGYCVPDEYVFYDDGISGRSVKKRKAFNDMIAFAKARSTHSRQFLYGNSAGLPATRKKASYISPCCGASACR